MGGYYARAQGEADAVADAVRDHYKPVGQGDNVPTAPVTVAVSLADKLDTIVGFFLIGQEPTGSKDPFALRRASIASGNLATTTELRLPLLVTFANAILGYVETAYNWSQRAVPVVNQQVATLNRWTELREFATDQGIFHGLPTQPKFDTVEIQAAKELLLAVKFETAAAMISRAQHIVAFMFDRLKVQQREAGVRHDLIDAVFALGGEDDLVRLLARVKALQGFVGTDEGANLLAGYKRAANILKQAESVDPNAAAPADLGNEEQALLSALDSAEPKAVAAIENEQFEDAMAALASLRAPIDAFFDGVMVNDPDPEKRAFRLGLLARFRDAVSQVADFSKIEG
jgi:glycyl-tRNA synthetase beta chain